MEGKDEILAVVKALGTRMDEGFARVDEQFATLRTQFAEQLDALSDSVHAEVRRSEARVRAEVNLVGAKAEQLDSKIALVGENVGNVIRQLSRYNTEVEAPLERRVSGLEVRVTRLEKKKERN